MNSREINRWCVIYFLVEDINTRQNRNTLYILQIRRLRLRKQPPYRVTNYKSGFIIFRWWMCFGTECLSNPSTPRFYSSLNGGLLIFAGDSRRPLLQLNSALGIVITRLSQFRTPSPVCIRVSHAGPHAFTNPCIFRTLLTRPNPLLERGRVFFVPTRVPRYQYHRNSVFYAYVHRACIRASGFLYTSPVM